MGFATVASYAEVERIIEAGSRIRASDRGLSIKGSNLITAGLYRLDGDGPLGRKARGSFINRAEQALVSYIVSDVADAVKELFPLPDPVKKAIYDSCLTPSNLAKDLRIRNILKYAELFAKHPEISMQRRCEFVEKYLGETLSQLAIDVEFFDILPRIEAISVRTDADRASATVNPAQTLEGEGDQNTGEWSNRLERTGFVLADLCNARDEFKGATEDAKRYSVTIRKLLSEKVLSYEQAYEMLADNSMRLSEHLAKFIEKRDVASETRADAAEQVVKKGVKVSFFTKANGARCPFREWIDSLAKDQANKISAALDRLQSEGHYGDFKRLECYNNLYELRFLAKQGLRVFFSYRSGGSILVWTGGHHDDQDRILKQIERWTLGTTS
jgi:putative component of toxin-antitoxin plasmid stabilization module